MSLYIRLNPHDKLAKVLQTQIVYLPGSYMQQMSKTTEMHITQFPDIPAK